MTRESDIHHHFFTRADWTKRKVDKLVRDHPLSKSLMHIPEHVDLHRYVEPLKPPVERYMSELVLRTLRAMPEQYMSLDAAKSLVDLDLHEISQHLNRQIPFLELSASALKRRMIL